MHNKRIISRAIIEAEERERNRLGAELHDNVNQLLVGARLLLSLELKRQPVASKYLQNADQQISLAVEEIRVLTHRLTSAFISNEGLQRSIDEIVISLWKAKKIRIKTSICEETIVKLSPGQQLMVYRIIQEQTNNILKYAETKTAELSLQEKGYHAELIISDKGKGFDKTEQKMKGIGFVNMLNRAEAFNGEMKVTSFPGKGCKVVVRFPMKEEGL